MDLARVSADLDALKYEVAQLRQPRKLRVRLTGTDEDPGGNVLYTGVLVDPDPYGTWTDTDKEFTAENDPIYEANAREDIVADGSLVVEVQPGGGGAYWLFDAGAGAGTGPPVVRINGVERDGSGRYRGFLLTRDEAHPEDHALAYTVAESIAVGSLNRTPLLPDREYFARRGGLVTLDLGDGSGSGSGSGSGDGPLRLYTVEAVEGIYEGWITSTTALPGSGSGSGSGPACTRRYPGVIRLLYPNVGDCGTRFTVYRGVVIHVTGSAAPSRAWPYAVQYKGQLAQTTRTVTCGDGDHTVPATFSVDLDALAVEFDDRNGSPVHRTVNLAAVAGGTAVYDDALGGWHVPLVGDDGGDWLFTFSPCGGATVRVEGPNATYNLLAGEAIAAGSTSGSTPPTAWDQFRLEFIDVPFASDAPGADPTLTLTATITGAALGDGSDYYETLAPICCTPTGADDAAVIDDAPQVIACGGGEHSAPDTIRATTEAFGMTGASTMAHPRGTIAAQTDLPLTLQADNDWISGPVTDSAGCVWYARAFFFIGPGSPCTIAFLWLDQTCLDAITAGLDCPTEGGATRNAVFLATFGPFSASGHMADFDGGLPIVHLSE